MVQIIGQLTSLEDDTAYWVASGSPIISNSCGEKVCMSEALIWVVIKVLKGGDKFFGSWYTQKKSKYTYICLHTHKYAHTCTTANL